jgi:hypothetical protein
MPTDLSRGDDEELKECCVFDEVDGRMRLQKLGMLTVNVRVWAVNMTGEVEEKLATSIRKLINYFFHIFVVREASSSIVG